MTVSQIDLIHLDPILNNTRFIVQYQNTVTNVISNIICTNNTGSTISADQFGLFFLANANFDNTLFTVFAQSGSNTFNIRANNEQFVFVNYIKQTRTFFSNWQNSLVGFVFDIYSVNITPVPVDEGLPVGTRTPIDSQAKIKFCNSPIFVRETACEKLRLEIFVWTGSIVLPLAFPVAILEKDKVSINDNYISIEISDIIKPFINPQFAYNRAAPPAYTNQGVFLQVKKIKTLTDGSNIISYTPTNFVTLGYLFNFEQNQQPLAPFVYDRVKWFNPKVHNYFYFDFNFELGLLATTEAIPMYNTPATNPNRCTLDPTLIVFINKLGLWETFTPHGKVTTNAKIERTDSNIAHRDPSQINNTYTHSRILNNIDVTQTYTINTGALTENMVSLVEELVYSPKIYLIKFTGDLEETSTVGITIDNTFITIDNTEITIDSQTITDEQLGFYKTFKQIPVTISDTDFEIKTRLNNKNAIDFNIKFDETNNKINAIR